MRQPLVHRTSLLDPAKRDEIREMFVLFDTDGSGTMETDEIRVTLWALGFQPESSLKFNAEGDVERMLAECFGMSLDDASQASFSLGEFMEVIAMRLAAQDQSESLLHAFNAFDAENKGVVLLRDIKRVAKEIDFDIRDDELEMIMNHLDADGGGGVSCDEWIRVMSQHG